MTKRIRFMALLIAVLLIAATLSGCALLQRFLPDFGSRPEQTLKERAELGTYHVETDENDTVTMTANVTIPDYSRYIDDLIDEAEERTDNEEDFEKELYALLAEEIEADGDPVMTEHEIFIDLTALDPEKEQVDWMYEELIAAAQDAAFEREIEEYCLELLTEVFPEEYAEDAADYYEESEASAE